jgi:hypothetical protein
VLAALPPHQVMLTVVGLGQEVELYLTFTEPAPGCVEIGPRGAVLLTGGAG